MTGAAAARLGGATAVYLAANTVLRGHVENGRTGWLVAALVLYTVGNVMFLQVMRASGMAVAIALSSVVQLVVAGLIAVAVFGERPAPLQLAGMALRILAVALIVWPEGAGR